MTTRPSISRREGEGRKDEGFFLQVEGASIDKQDHAANPCGQIGETVAFDKAIQVARAYAAKHPDTLIIVTADHAHTSQIVEEVTRDPGPPEHPLTKDGAPIYINYGTVAPGPRLPAAHRLAGPHRRPGPAGGQRRRHHRRDRRERHHGPGPRPEVARGGERGAGPGTDAGAGAVRPPDGISPKRGIKKSPGDADARGL